MAGVLVAAAMLGACGADTLGAPDTDDAVVAAAVEEVVAAEVGGTLFVGTPGGVAAVDEASGDVEWSLTPAIPSPDWATLVTSAVDAVPQTTVTARSSAGETVRWTATVPGAWEVRQVASGGEAVVLGPPRTGAVAGELGVDARERTPLTVVRSDGSVARLDLEGNLEPEAFAADARGLFVIQYSPAMAPTGYRVRWLDLATGEVTDAVDRHGVLQADMPGLARTQVRSPDGQRLYTYYAVGPDAAHDRPSYAFVHVLDLAEGWAHCVDLPSPWGAGGQGLVGITVSPDGRELWVVDPELGAAALVDTGSLDVVGAVDIEPRTATTSEVAAGPGGRLYVATGREVTVVDRATLAVESTWTVESAATSIDVSPDGRRLYLGSVHPGPTPMPVSRIEVVDTSTGDTTRTLEPELPATIAYLGRERTPLPYGTKECAC